jgi:hypothetical protein
VANESNQKETCKKSVLIYSTAARWGMPLSDSIKCPTKYITISTNNNYDAERTIANEMYDCWDNFGQGKQELFGAQNENFCVVCSVISFSGVKGDIDGFSEFLANEKIPTRDETYFEFLSPDSTDYQSLKDEAAAADSQFSIDTSSSYAVMLMYAKKSRWSTISKTATGATIGTVAAAVILIATGVGSPVGIALLLGTGMSAGAVVGGSSGAKSSEWQAAVMLVNSSDVGNIGCTYLQKTK